MLRFLRYTVCLLLSIAIPQLDAAAAQETEPKVAADPSLEQSAKAADAWLKLMDEGNYDETWDKSSATLELLIPKSHWKSLMSALRKPFGSVRSRKLIEQRPAFNPAGLPKGEYMVLVYSTSFSSRPNAHELVTMVKESDGNWKVLTYQAN